MKILIVNDSVTQGGAARSAYRLHQSLLGQNIDSEILSNEISNEDYKVTVVPNTPKKKFFLKIAFFRDRLLLKKYPNRTKTLFSANKYSTGDTVKAINMKKPDIVHLHWVNHGMLTVEDIAKIEAPIVWSLHDNWAFTGGCHIKWECDKYQNSCGACPRLNSSKENDLSRKIWNRKKRVFTNLNNLTIIGLSKWINSCSLKSSLLKSIDHINLPNPLNTNIYKPLERFSARYLWGLPKDKTLVLFGAISATSDINKGFQELNEAIKKLDRSNIEFIIFGSSEPQNAPDLGCPTHYVGRLHDDISLIALYSAVDVMVVPSLQENLSNAIMESLSCGTPVVAFDIGGNSDMINHKENGYLAKPFDTTNLAKGIEWVINNENYESLCENAREKVVREFDNEVVAKKYIQLYKQILG